MGCGNDCDQSIPFQDELSIENNYISNDEITIGEQENHQFTNNGREENNNEDPQIEYTSVKYLSRDNFRKRLVEHFDILFYQNKVTWPSNI